MTKNKEVKHKYPTIEHNPEDAKNPAYMLGFIEGRLGWLGAHLSATGPVGYLFGGKKKLDGALC